jgi:hypothetical protein
MRLRSGKIICSNIEKCDCERCKLNSYYITNIKKCSHKCCLEFTNKCCGCSDKRKISLDLYPKYIDQIGNQNIISRSFYYCPICREPAQLFL